MGLHSLWVLFDCLCPQVGWLTFPPQQTVKILKRTYRFIHGVPRRARNPELLMTMKKTTEEAVRKAAKQLAEKQTPASEENLLRVSAAVCRIPCPCESCRKSRV